MQLSEFDLERHEAERVPSPGICIYCREVTEGLTDEHVIPYALAANTIILERSCCLACQSEITRYEQDVLRDQLGIFRAQIDAPSRTRRKKRPTHASIRFVEVDAFGKFMRELLTKTFPIAELPIIFNLWQSPPPTILQEPARTLSQPWSFVEKDVAIRMCREVAEQTGAVNVAMKLGEVNRENYLRSLAKTAHAFATARFGLNAFEPYLTDIILNRSNDLERFVGDLPGHSPFEDHPAHTMQMSAGEIPDGPAAGLLVVRIQLYPRLKSPEHMVIVGKSKEDIGARFA